MPSSPGKQYDFFLSRRGSVAAIAREVTDILTEKGYKVLVQDYDIPLGASFVEAMHEAIINSRDLIILFTEDYLRSPYTRKEFTSFEAERVKTSEERHIIVLRCEDVPLRGLLADNVYQTLVGIEDPEERKRRIIAAAERQSQAAPPPPRPFIGVAPRTHHSLLSPKKYRRRKAEMRGKFGKIDLSFVSRCGEKWGTNEISTNCSMISLMIVG